MPALSAIIARMGPGARSPDFAGLFLLGSKYHHTRHELHCADAPAAGA
jgi:hypothetical protein